MNYSPLGGAMPHVLEALRHATGHEPVKSGSRYSCHCPAHDDQNPSLSVREGDDGRVLVYCHAGCATESVVGAAGLTMADLFPPETQPHRPSKGAKPRSAHGSDGPTFATDHEAIAALERQYGPRTQEWTYHAPDGVPIGVVVRWDRASGKIIRPVGKHGDGWRASGMAKPYPLYRLPELAEAETVYVVEGEKAADALRELGLVATTSPHGAQAANSAGWTPLAGKRVNIIPDNDVPGMKYAVDVATILGKLVPRSVVKIVELTGLPDKGDVVDWIAASPDATPEMLRRELEGQVERTEQVELGRSDGPLHYRPFPVELLGPLAPFVRSAAAATNTDPAMVALPLVTALGAAVGGTRAIQVNSEWVEPCVIWAGLVAYSGDGKTPAAKPVLQPIRKRDAALQVANDEAMKEYNERKLKFNVEAKRWEKDYASGDQGDTAPPEPPTPPPALRHIVQDVTPEKLVEFLEDNPRGVLMVRDELAGLLGGFDRYSKGGGAERSMYLSIFNSESIRVDRKTGERTSIYVPKPHLSIYGGIQPEVLHRKVSDDDLASGLLARFLVAMPPAKPIKWSEATIPSHAKEAVEGIFNRLYQLDFCFVDGRPEALAISLSNDAGKLFGARMEAHAQEALELTGGLRTAWPKLRSYAARLALIVHLVRVAAKDDSVADPEVIDAESVRIAWDLVDWFGHEARRIYALRHEPDADQKLRKLAEWIRYKGCRVTARLLQQGRRDITSAEEANASLQSLVDAGYGYWWYDDHGGGPGRPLQQFVLNEVKHVYGNSAFAEEEGNSVDVDNRENPENGPDEWEVV